MNNQIAMNLRNQMLNNPQQFAQNALRSGYFNRSEMHRNALEAVASGNVEEMKKIGTNVCEQHNVSLDDAQRQFRQYYYGMQ